MPSSITHNYFGLDVYNKLNDNIKKKITPSINYYKVFCQGPDPYFFYDFHLTKRSKKIHKINKNMQHTKINEHFITLINYINNKNYYNNSMVMSYLYGQICHYILDSTTHPYITYMSGSYNEKDKATFKYNGKHEEIEYYIDCYLIYKREKILPKKYKAYKHLFNIKNFNNETKDTIDTTIKEVYNFDNVSKIYLKSLLDMKKFYHIFNYDRLGIKKLLYNIMDKVCPDSIVKKRELSFNIDPTSKLHYLNFEKESWNHPCDINEIYNYSFTELYLIAIQKAAKTIATIDEMLQRKDIDNKKLSNLIGNLDYGTGKDCNLNLKSKYFRY